MGATRESSSTRKRALKKAARKHRSAFGRGDPQEQPVQEVLGDVSGEAVDATGEELGSTFVENVTGANDAAATHREVLTEEETGGPFVSSSAGAEFADGVDGANPLDAEAEPFPTTRQP